MPEAYVWPEGQIYIWTGTATASAVVSFAENSNLQVAYGWDNRPNLSGTYRDHLTGKRADLSIAALYTIDGTIQRMADSATAVHIKLIHNTINGSAGFFLYSGRLDNIAYQGDNAAPYKYALQYHANVWSGFGSAI